MGSSHGQHLQKAFKLKHFVNTDTLKLFFNAHIKTHIDYASPVWDMCPNNHFQTVNSLYRRSAKLILADPTLSTDGKMEKLNIFPLEKQLQHNKCVLMYKVIQSKVPIYLSALFQHSQMRYENSRSGFTPIRPRIDLVKMNITYSGVTLWDSLPASLREKPTIASFKTTLRTYLTHF